jgi:protein SCO1/2/putative membrane protein
MNRFIPFFLGGVFFSLLVCTSGCTRQAQFDDFGPVSQFSLVNQDGSNVTRDDLRGKVWIAAFVFTRCAGPCTQISGSMARLQKELAGENNVVLVSFTVDPDYDNPKVLKKYAQRFQADPDRWMFLTGGKKAVYDLIVKSFKLTAQETPEADRKPGYEVTHDTRLVLVDGQGHIRGYFQGTEDEDLQKLRAAAQELAGDPAWLRGQDLPGINAILNGTSALLLTAGFLFIRLRLVRAHVFCMLSALVVSTVFLASYIYYHYAVKGGQATEFSGEGGVRIFYYVVLVSHMILAALVTPLALFTAYLGLSGNWARHVRIARWTFPVWLYVSVTGVFVYLMLYHLYPPRP